MKIEDVYKQLLISNSFYYWNGLDATKGIITTLNIKEERATFNNGYTARLGIIALSPEDAVLAPLMCRQDSLAKELEDVKEQLEKVSEEIANGRKCS